MIAPFTPAAGTAGGLGPTTTPGAAPVPGADGFDALLGQLSAALLSTVADAPGAHLTHAEATPGHVDGVEGEPAADSAAVVDPALLVFAVSPLPVVPTVSTPPVFDASSSVATGSHEGDDVAHAVVDVGTALSPGPSSSSHARTTVLVAPDVGTAGEAAHGIGPATASASHVHAEDVDPSGDGTAWAAPVAETATSSSMAAGQPASGGQSPPTVALSASGSIEPSAVNRAAGARPLDRITHERPSGRRPVELTAEATSSPAPMSPSIGPVTSLVDPVPAEPSTAAESRLGDGLRGMVTPGGERREAPPSDVTRRGNRFIGPYERVAGHATQGRSAGAPDQTTSGSPTVPLPAEPALVGATAPVGTSSPAVVDAEPAELPPVQASWPQPSARARALGRALDAQTHRVPEQAAPAGLVAQVARSVAMSDVPTEANGAVGDVANRRAGRMSTSPAARSTSGVPVSLGATADANTAVFDHPTSSAPAPAQTWRAALASIDGGGDLAAGAAPAAPTVLPLAAFAAFVRPPVDDLPVAVDRTAVEAPTLDAATGESVHGQIVRSLKVQWTGGLSEARVTLRPEFLGEVVATITVEHGVVSATLQADTPEVRRWMEAHTGSLRDALVEHGLKLDRLTVAEPARESADADRQGRSRGRQPEAPPSRRRRTPDAREPQFELTA